MTLRKIEIFIGAALDRACLLFVNYSVLCLCSRTHLSSFCTSSGAVHQAVWRMQFKCKFPAMDKDLLKAPGQHRFTKRIFVGAPKYGRQWFYVNLYSDILTVPWLYPFVHSTSIINKRACGILESISFIKSFIHLFIDNIKKNRSHVWMCMV